MFKFDYAVFLYFPNFVKMPQKIIIESSEWVQDPRKNCKNIIDNILLMCFQRRAGWGSRPSSASSTMRRKKKKYDDDDSVLYKVAIITGDVKNAGTDAKVSTSRIY